jgi:hypothetical protein
MDPVKSEYLLVCSATKYLSNEGYRVRQEVSNMGQSIDIVATRNGLVTAIEAKISNWRRALQQCKAHALVVDFIVIALKIKKVPIELLNTLNANGWGLLIYNNQNDDWHWEVKPLQNNRIWVPQQRYFLEGLEKVNYAT